MSAQSDVHVSLCLSHVLVVGCALCAFKEVHYVVGDTVGVGGCGMRLVAMGRCHSSFPGHGMAALAVSVAAAS